MQKVQIAQVDEQNRAGFYALAAEYLPGSDAEKMQRFEALYPKAFLALVLDGTVIGAAFGWPRLWADPTDPSFALDGIAVRADHQQKGYGTQLLAAFEKAAGQYGARCVSLGSAGGYVEQFYIARGYCPKQYKVWIDDRTVLKKVFEDLEDYRAYCREEDDGFVVMEKQLERSEKIDE